MIDEVTGLEMEPWALQQPLEPLWLVTNGRGLAYSCHPSHAAAKAWIAWNGRGKELIVKEI